MKLPPLLPPYEQRATKACLKRQPEDSVDPIFGIYNLIALLWKCEEIKAQE